MIAAIRLRIIGMIWIIEIAPWFYLLYGLAGGTLATAGTIFKVMWHGRKAL